VKTNCTIVTEFQFHNGPIKSWLLLAGALGLVLFQFHNGPIKSL